MNQQENKNEVADRLDNIYKELKRESFWSILASFLNWNEWERQLWDKESSRDRKADTLVMALSFGILPDGSPGDTNEYLAGVLAGLIGDDGVTEDRIWLQWEIADVLKVKEGECSIEHSKLHVIPPPKFEPSDILKPRKFVKELRSAGDNERSPKGYVYFKLKDEFDHESLSRKELADALNELLCDNGFCVEYLNTVEDKPELEDLERWEHLGQEDILIGYEARELPQEPQVIEEMKQGKRVWQAMRVNRLIIESIFPGIVERGRYLSTWDVCEKMAEANPEYREVILVVHQDHFYKCYELLNRFAESQGRNRRVFLADGCEQVPYDGRSAQSWTKNKSSWQKYEIITWRRELMEREILNWSL